MIRIRLFVALLASTFILFTPIFAQNSRQILDNTAKRLNGKTMQATFKATTFANGKIKVEVQPDKSTLKIINSTSLPNLS